MEQGELLRILPGLLLLGCVLWLTFRKRKASPVASEEPVPDGPLDEPYRVYTREYDLELHAKDVAVGLTDANDDYWRGWTDRYGIRWKQAIELSERYFQEFASLPKQTALPERRDLALAFLVDQSGSMKGDPIAAVAASLRSVAGDLAEAGVKFEILGFSTAGWRGGSAFQKWLTSGRPPRPGRVCALLHVIYKASDEPRWTDESYRAMLNPDILRENVDGEAIEWAISRLTKVDAARKQLIVISDGAPVDDATLLHNGLSYLERHLQAVISGLEIEDAVTVGAIGIGDDYVENYYSYFRSSELAGLPTAIIALIDDMQNQQPHGGNPWRAFTSPSPPPT